MKTFKVIAVMVAVIVLGLTISSVAHAKDTPDCTVNSTFDDAKGDGGSNTLRDVIARVNSIKGVKNSGCYRSVELIPTVIDVGSTYEISAPRSVSEETRIVIGSDLDTQEGYVPQRTILNLHNMKKPTFDDNDNVIKDGFQDFTDADKDKWCAVIISGDYITLKNLIFKSSPVATICIKGSNVRLENVTIQNGEGSGIKIHGDAKKTFIDALSSIDNVTDGFGIEFLDGADTFSSNIIEGTNRTVKGTDENGLAKLIAPESGNESNFTFNYMEGSEAIKSNSKYTVVFDTMIPEKEAGAITAIKLSGGVADTTAAAGELCAFDKFSKQVKRIHVYGYDMSLNDGSLRFINYITTANASSGFGLQSTASTTGGRFGVRIPVTSGEFKDITYIMMIPEFIDGSFGGSSKTIQLNSSSTNFNSDCRATTTGGSGGGGTSLYWHANPSACSIMIGASNGAVGWHIDYYDSDFDGIEDRYEDTTADCVYQPGVDASNMWEADTDTDGIADYEELYKTFSATKDGTSVEITCINTADCDGDGVNDGIEDRSSRTYRSNAPSYLYYYRTSGITGGKPFLDINQKMVPCTLTANGLAYGISYDVYKIVNASKQISVYSGEEINKDTESVQILVCKNATVAVKTNYNGVYDHDVGETDFLNREDGFKSCPDGTLNSLTGKCEYTCLPALSYEIFLFMTDQNYVAYGPDGIPTGLKDAVTYNADGTKTDGADGKPDLFQESPNTVKSVCSDMDSDGIPDCIENPTGTCIENSNGLQGTYLNPYEADSDGDGVNDRIDADPFDKQISNVKDVNRVELAEIFAKNPQLYMFLDRDGDGLGDGVEDANGNGEIDSNTTLAGIGKTETDPLNPDSDGDGLSDYEEVMLASPRTNPMNPDSDTDGASDMEEMGGDYTYTPAVALSDPIFGIKSGCNKSATLKNYTEIYFETNPIVADTDGDGIKDGREISDTHTNPNAYSSDGDKFSDGEEDSNQNGLWPVFLDGVVVKEETDSGKMVLKDYKDSNPCLADTDQDGLDDDDAEEKYQCRVNPDEACVPNAKASGGLDSDNDGLEDVFEANFNTDPYNPDTDNDNLMDGEELAWHVANNKWTSNTFLPQYGETDPNQCVVDESMEGAYKTATVAGVEIYYLASVVGGSATGVESACKIQVSLGCGADSDGDGMPDFAEVRYGTNPANIDSDEDGIIDGIETGWLVAEKTADGVIKFRPQVGQYEFVSSNNVTNAMDSDTDDDGLVDGFADTINYEDVNCSGKVDTDTNGRPMETNPRNANSDGDGQGNDMQEALKSGQFNAAGAYSFDKGGCSVNGANGETWGMTLMFAALLLGTKLAATRKRSASKAK